MDLCGGGAVWWREGQSLIVNKLHPVEVKHSGPRGLLHLMGGKVVLLDAVGVSHHGVILVEAPHAIHFIVDEAGNVLNVLHVGPEGSTRRRQGQKT